MSKLIPKKIHYCWFGGNELDQLSKKCIASWKKYLPDYEIIEWNEKNFDINQNMFVQQAYQQKKYAFVSDYVRLYALYNYGGIYMDVDVEVIRPLNQFLLHRAFTGNEGSQYCITGTMGAEKGHPWIKILFEHYKNQKFIEEDGSLNMTTNTVLITNATIKHFDWERKDVYQVLQDDLHIYPFDYFCAKSYKIFITDNTFTIHHYNGSWLTKNQKATINIKRRVKRILRKYFGYK